MGINNCLRNLLSLKSLEVNCIPGYVSGPLAEKVDLEAYLHSALRSADVSKASQIDPHQVLVTELRYYISETQISKPSRQLNWDHQRLLKPPVLK